MILGRGAEAVVSLADTTVIKERISKSYRIPALDIALRKQRTRQEARLLQKAGDFVPKVFDVDELAMTITMEHIPGILLRDFIDSCDSHQRHDVFFAFGTMVGLLHDKDIIHGDLTTSNILRTSSGDLRLIDFGLGFISVRVEDKAVDLSVFRHALESKHYASADRAFASFLEGYRRSPRSSAVLSRLALVDRRGRYKRKTQNL